MADTQNTELRVREKQEATSPAEQTKPGLVFTPAVDIFETEKEITLLADMPGVKAALISAFEALIGRRIEMTQASSV